MLHSRLRIGAILVAAALIATVAAQESTQLSVWDGVYTSAQAERGHVLYDRHCGECHGDDLEGDAEAPALAGSDFLWKWNGATLHQLFQRVHRDMPLYKAGSLSQPTSAAILAFILSACQLPPGRIDLSPNEQFLKQILIEPSKNSGKAK